MKILNCHEDRISELPDAILCHILSYIPTKQSVSTSVLSKRWKQVWTFVHVIDIDDSSILEPTDLQEESYITFIDNVFNLFHAKRIDKFSLKCNKFDKFRVNKLIHSVMRRKVLQLDLCISDIYYSELTLARFAYKELVSLNLKFGDQYDLLVNTLKTVCFPSLKKLHLHNSIEFSDEDFANILLSSCPVLEDLHLKRCVAKNLKILDVKSLSLKFLTISMYVYDFGDPGEFKIILDTPKLEVLKYSGHLAQNGFCFKNHCTQLEAYIDVDNIIDNIVEIIPCGVIELVRGISNAKTIHLGDDFLKVLSILDVKNLPIFRNLTKLLLNCSKSCGKLLPHVLRNSPNLEVLILTKAIGYSWTDEEFEWNPPIDVPECLSARLKVVQIWGHYMHEDLQNFESYIQSNAKVLNEFSVFQNTFEQI